LFRRRVTIGHADIAAPYDLGFQLRHYVVAPELREAEKLVDIVRLASGGLAKVDVESSGTSAAPCIDLAIPTAGDRCRFAADRRSRLSLSQWSATLRREPSTRPGSSQVPN
jgi:hypothetical protein